MTRWQMVLSRIFFALFGWIPGLSSMVKRVLVFVMIKKSKHKYVASSQYFSWDDVR